MTSTQRPTEPRRRPKDRKQQIQVVARDLFVERGFHNVAMSLIAERVGITAGALYRHFANKAVLLEAVLQDAFSDLDPIVEEGEGLAEALERNVPRSLTRPYLGPLWAREARHLPEDARGEIRRQVRQSTQAWVPLILAERPDLSSGQADLLSWGIASLLTSSGHYAGRVSASTLREAVLRACLAVCSAELETPRAPEPPVDGCLQVFSRRERLLVAATRLFGEKGYQATALGDIGAAADVTGPNLYGYYESKAALLLAVIERTTQALWLDLESVLTAHSDPRAALSDLVPRYVERSLGWSGVGSGELSGEPEVESAQRAYGREYVAEWVALLREARPELDPTTVRVLVQGTVFLVADLTRTPHLTADGGFPSNLASMALAVLDS